MKLRIDGEIVLSDLAPKPLERLRAYLSVPNPAYQRLKRLKLHTAGEPRKLEAMIEMPDDTVHIPRGAVAVLRDVCNADQIPWTIEHDGRADGEGVIRPAAPQQWAAWQAAPALRDFQEEGVRHILKHWQGLIVLPCGTGKSRLGIAAVHAVNRTTLIVVPTEDLVDQWCDALRELIGVVAGRVGGGLREIDRDVVVGIPNTLTPLLEEEPALGQRFGFVVVDEVHRCPINLWQRLLRLLPAKRRLGLTATPEREDGLSPIMHWSFGPTLLERTTAEMIQAGYLSRAEIDTVETGWSFSYVGPEKKRLAAMDRQLAENQARTARIVERVASDAKSGESVLVLANRRTMVKDLTAQLALRGVDVVGLTGSTAKKKRKKAIVDLRSGGLAVMVATSLADEGLDIARLSRIHLAYPQKARGATLQRLGRILRTFPGKKPRLIDYIDSEVPTLVRRASERMRVYRDCGLVP